VSDLDIPKSYSLVEIFDLLKLAVSHGLESSDLLACFCLQSPGVTARKRREMSGGLVDCSGSFRVDDDLRDEKLPPSLPPRARAHTHTRPA
jgi:hypothetical protein